MEEFKTVLICKLTNYRLWRESSFADLNTKHWVESQVQNAQDITSRAWFSAHERLSCSHFDLMNEKRVITEHSWATGGCKSHIRAAQAAQKCPRLTGAYVCLMFRGSIMSTTPTTQALHSSHTTDLGFQVWLQE